MKKILFIAFCFGLVFNSMATDPIKRKTFFIEFDVTYPFYHHYNQILFKKSGLGLGGAISIGHQQIPVYLEYNYQSPIQFAYRNNKVIDSYHELGLRYNLNHLTYLIPYGIDPYVGAGVMRRNNRFTQYAIGNSESGNILRQHQQSTLDYKLSGGVKLGNRNFILGLHYDFLPRGLSIQSPENDPLNIYNSIHIFSVRVGFRIHTQPGKKVKCPRFNHKQKRTLAF